MVEYKSTEYETSMADQEAFPEFHPMKEGLLFYPFPIFALKRPPKGFTFGKANSRRRVGPCHRERRKKGQPLHRRRVLLP